MGMVVLPRGEYHIGSCYPTRVDFAQIPLYAVYKLWSSLISPMLLGRGAAPASAEDTPTESVSKRQDKLRKRQERGDPRVQARSVRK